MIHEAGTQHTKTSGLEKREGQYSHFLETHGLKSVRSSKQLQKDNR